MNNLKLYLCVLCEQKFTASQLHGRVGELGICDPCSVERANLDLLLKPKAKSKKSLTVEIDEELLDWVKAEKDPSVSLREIVEWGLNSWKTKMQRVILESDARKLK